MDAYWRTPPVARYVFFCPIFSDRQSIKLSLLTFPSFLRTAATAVFVTSVAVYSGLLSGRFLYFHPSVVFKLYPEPWRLLTTFTLTLPKLSILMDPYFLYSYISQLEVGNARFSRREDLIWYMSFIGLAVLVRILLARDALFLILCHFFPCAFLSFSSAHCAPLKSARIVQSF